MTEDSIRAALVDHQVLGLTMWAEGRGDWRQGNSSVEERLAIGCVVRNRLPHWTRYKAIDPNVKSICLAPWQFSCWNPGVDANHVALMALAARVVAGQPLKDRVADESIWLAVGIINGVIVDRTGGATSYYAPKAMDPAGRVPGWAVGQAALAIGDQLFLTV